MVRSAAKFVSKTRSKPSLLTAASIFPVTSVPGGYPNSSPRAARTAGASWTTTNFVGSERAFHTSSTLDFSVIAPTGQTTSTHPVRAYRFPEARLEGGLHLALEAPALYERAPLRPAFLTDRHAATAKDAFVRIAPEGRRGIVDPPPLLAPVKATSRTPSSPATSGSSQLRFLIAGEALERMVRKEHLHGEPLAFLTLVLVVTTMPSEAGRVQDACRFLFPATSTRQTLQAPMA